MKNGNLINRPRDTFLITNSENTLIDGPLSMRFPHVGKVNLRATTDRASNRIQRIAKRPLRTECKGRRPLRARIEVNSAPAHLDYWTFK
ncbi:hypothetical protein B7486_08900 [cyanobacterium TDX16]|nr:hypothetical protein B7486_08900 [cyanobacterium TDX16]